MKKPMTMKQWEKSPADKRMDKAGAKRAGVSMNAWEGSKADMKADRKAMKGKRK